MASWWTAARVLAAAAVTVAVAGLLYLEADDARRRRARRARSRKAAALAAQAHTQEQQQQQQEQQQAPGDAAAAPAGGLTKLDAVGGHSTKENKGPPILMKDGKVYKPLQRHKPGQAMSRGERELSFYREVFEGDEAGEVLRPWLPRLLGVESVGEHQYLVLENLTHGLKQPCVLDLKMGTQAYDEEATPEKIAREQKKYPPQSEIGFRIVGMRVFRPQHAGAAKGEPWRPAREWCLAVTPETMPAAVEQFFFDGRVLQYGLMQQLLERCSAVELALAHHRKYRIYGSSLLVVYDAAAPEAGLQVRMIDFAHLFPLAGGGVDEGYRHGLRFLQGLLRASLAARLGNQVGGTHGNISERGGALVKWEDPRQPRLFDNEVAFYRKCAASKDPLLRFLPELLAVSDASSPREIVISDAALLVRRPDDLLASVSVMDVKLGLRTFELDCANEPELSYFSKYMAFEQSLSPGRAEAIWEKVVGRRNGPLSLKHGKLGKRDYHAFRDATTTSVDLGFRLTALKHGDSKVTQSEAKTIETKLQFLERLEHFLYGAKAFETPIAKSYVRQLEAILAAARDSPLFGEHYMVGSSLLFLHCQGRAVVRWIDFAHTTPVRSADLNGIPDAIHRLILAFEELIEKYT